MFKKIAAKIFYLLLRIPRRFGYTLPRPIRYKDMVGRHFFLKDLYEKIQDIEGDVVECGVAYGESLVTLAILSKREGKGRVVIGYDSFAGFPDLSKEDTSTTRETTAAGGYKDCAMEIVNKKMDTAQVPRAKLVKGFFADTLPNYDGRIAFLFIDADIYSSYKECFKFLYDKVVKGGIIAFDEYNSPRWPGAKKAVDEHLLETKETIHFDTGAGKYYLIKGE